MRGLFVALLLAAAPVAAEPLYIVNGLIVDGSGGEPYRGWLSFEGDRILAMGRNWPPGRLAHDAKMFDAKGQAIAPGFINMLSWSNESLLVDGRALSDLKQGVTLEVMGEGTSMGPWTDAMKRTREARQDDIKYLSLIHI